MNWLHHYDRTDNPYLNLAESTVTSNVLFCADARRVVFSLTTSSGTASGWTLQGNEEDGLLPKTDGSAATALGEPDWRTNKAVTAQGYYSVDTLPRWARFLRTPSASSTTIRLTRSFGQ